MSHRRARSIPLAVALLGLTVGCEFSSSSSRPTPPAAPVAKPVAAKPAAPRLEGLRAGPSRLGPLSAKLAPTVEAVDEAMPDKYTVRAPAEGATPGAAVQVLLDDTVVLEIFGSDDGSYIDRAWSADKHVIFPWNTRVGDRIGDHKNWKRMTCVAAKAPFEGKAICNAFAEARISYLVEGWEGDVVPGKELLADLEIAGVVWTPDAPTDKAE